MDLMTTTEVMEFLKVSRTFIWRMIQEKKLTPQYPGGDDQGHPRFRRAEVESLFRPQEPKEGKG